MLKRNNFNGGPSGTTLTTSNTGQSGDDVFQGCFKIGANTVLAFDDAPDRPTAEFVMQSSTGAAAGQGAVQWTTGGVAQLWARMYVYYSVLPDNFNSPAFFYTETTGGLLMMEAAINSSGLRQIVLADSATGSASTAGGITAGKWFRVEIRAQFSATTGNADLRWYDDADSDTPTETISLTNKNFTANSCANVYFGYIDPADSNLETLRMSGLELNDTGWPGPAPFRPGKGVPGIQPNAIAIHTDAW